MSQSLPCCCSYADDDVLLLMLLPVWAPAMTLLCTHWSHVLACCSDTDAALSTSIVELVIISSRAGVHQSRGPGHVQQGWEA